jgi:flagellar protein FlgJ
MRTPEFFTAATPATNPVAGLSWNSRQSGDASSGAFSKVFSQLHSEVADVIRQGWPQGGAPALNAEGMALRAGLQSTQPPPAASAAGALQNTPGQQEFLDSIAPWAKEAGAALGIAPELVSAHAALESGWGRRPLRDAAGGNSHNLFGIKAQGGWNGARLDAMTTEVEDGTALKKTESFRSYPDYATAFRDYTRLLQDNPRYRAALNAGGDAASFAQGLARGGYATDPDYAAKLTRLATQLQSRD